MPGGAPWGCRGDVMGIVGIVTGMSWGCHGDVGDCRGDVCFVMGMSWGCHGDVGDCHVSKLPNIRDNFHFCRAKHMTIVYLVEQNTKNSVTKISCSSLCPDMAHECRSNP